MNTSDPILDIGRDKPTALRVQSPSIENEMAVRSLSFDALSDLSMAAVESSDRQAIRLLLVEDDKAYADVLIAELESAASASGILLVARSFS